VIDKFLNIKIARGAAARGMEIRNREIAMIFIFDIHPREAQVLDLSRRTFSRSVSAFSLFFRFRLPSFIDFLSVDRD